MLSCCNYYGRSAEAGQAARRAIALDPVELIALKVLARIHLNSGQPEMAPTMLPSRSKPPGERYRRPENALEEALVQQTKLPESTVKSQARPLPSPVVSESLKKLEPLFGDYAARTRAWRSLGPEHLLQLLSAGNYEAPIRIEQKPKPSVPGPDGFATVPPVALTMGYGSATI